MICPIHHVDMRVIHCPHDEDWLSARAELERNYWRWRFEGSEWALGAIPKEFWFMKPKTGERFDGAASQV